MQGMQMPLQTGQLSKGGNLPNMMQLVNMGRAPWSSPLPSGHAGSMNFVDPARLGMDPAAFGFGPQTPRGPKGGAPEEQQSGPFLMGRQAGPNGPGSVFEAYPSWARS